MDLVLRSGALAAVPGDVLLSNIPQLLHMGRFFSQFIFLRRLLSVALLGSPQVADAICIAFGDLWALNPRKVQMPFAAVLFVLVQLGANPSVLEGIGLTPERASKNHVTHTTLLEALKRLLAIVKAAGLSVKLLNSITEMLMNYVPVLTLSLPMM